MKFFGRLLGGRRSLASDLAYGQAIAISFVLGTLTLYLYFYQVRDGERELQKTAESQANSYAAMITLPLWNLDTDTLQAVSKAFLESETVVRLQIEDSDESLDLQDSDYDRSDSRFTITRDVRYGDAKIGKAIVTFTKLGLERSRRRLFYFLLLLIAFSIVTVSGATMFLLNRFLRRPMRKLSEGLSVVAGGD